MMGFAVLAARLAFAMPRDLPANWIFRIVPFRGGARYVRARRRALLVVSVGPGVDRVGGRVPLDVAVATRGRSPRGASAPRHDSRGGRCPARRRFPSHARTCQANRT